MTDLKIPFRGNDYVVTYDEEHINWINVYIVFVNDPYLNNLIQKNFFHVLQVTNETRNTYWFSSNQSNDKEANEFKRVVADAIRNSNKELI